MKLHLYIYILVALISSNPAVAKSQIEGRWKGTGQELNLFEWKGKVVGGLQNSRTDYSFSFDPTSFKGNLETFDRQYGCRLDNGESQIELINKDKISIIFNQINFDVQETYVGTSQPVYSPAYCSNGLDVFICGWNLMARRPSKIECVVRFRQPIKVDLERLN